MKSIRRAILGNQEYHHNLLDGEFESLVKEATDKHLMRPDARVNRNVTLAPHSPGLTLLDSGHPRDQRSQYWHGIDPDGPRHEREIEM